MEKRTPRTPRAAPANFPIGDDSRPRNDLEGCRPDLFFKTLRTLKCGRAVELLKITDMEFGIEGSFNVGARKFCFHGFLLLKMRATVASELSANRWAE